MTKFPRQEYRMCFSQMYTYQAWSTGRWEARSRSFVIASEVGMWESQTNPSAVEGAIRFKMP